MAAPIKKISRDNRKDAAERLQTLALQLNNLESRVQTDMAEIRQALRANQETHAQTRERLAKLEVAT